MISNNQPFLSVDLSGEPCDLRARNLCKSYSSFSLGPVSLDVPRGSVVGLVGQNGAGKTTLMKAMLGGIRVDSGSAELFGVDVTRASEAELVAAKGRMGFVSAVTSYPPGMTVAEVARMAELAYPRFSMAEFRQLCERMGLDMAASTPNVEVAGGRRTRMPRSPQTTELSRGMGMKLQLSVALAAGTDLLVMDEPTAGLDPIVREEFLDVLREWMEPEGRSALISSHITSDLEKVADYVVMLHEGRVVLSCERDTLEQMGVARLRTAEAEQLLAGGLIPAGMARIMRRDLSVEVLVPSRAEFERAFPSAVCDRAGIDDVLTFLVKGEVR